LVVLHACTKFESENIISQSVLQLSGGFSEVLRRVVDIVPGASYPSMYVYMYRPSEAISERYMAPSWLAMCAKVGSMPT
jgi:hypothetical protein